MGKHDVEREKSNANMCVSLSHSMWFHTANTQWDTWTRSSSALAHSHRWTSLKLPIHGCDCFDTIRYDTKRYIFVPVRLFRSFNALLTCLLARSPASSLTRSLAFAKAVRSITHTLVRSLALHGLLSLLLSHSLSPPLCAVCVVKLLKRVAHTQIFLLCTDHFCIYVVTLALNLYCKLWCDAFL